MLISVKIPQSTFLQSQAHIRNWPWPALFQSVPGYKEMKLCLPSTATVKYFSLPDLPTAPDGLVLPPLSFPKGVEERKELEKRQEAQNLPIPALVLTQHVKQGWSQRDHRLVIG